VADPDALPARSDTPRPKAVVLGHISPTKRTDLAVHIARVVIAKVPEFELEIVGAAQYRDEDFALERELRESVAADPQLKERVRFTGHDPRALNRLADAALLLHCRPDEPFGMVLIEAMAVGVPVVAPSTGGPAEIVEDGETGFLYPPGDVGAAAERVMRLLRDRELAERMSRAAAERARARYSVERQVAASRRVLAELA
jgi:glycosyltransferase involved in cell wall biosynthesis